MGGCLSSERGGEERTGVSLPNLNDFLNQPILKSGFHGSFPSSFNIYFFRPGGRKGSDHYLISCQKRQPIAPLYAFADVRGSAKHQIVLYAGTDENAPPFGFTSAEKMFGSISTVSIAGIPNGGNHVRPLKKLKSFATECISFEIKIGSKMESFEWRSDSVLKPVPNRGFGCTLLRTARGNEMVASWVDELNPEDESMLGTFRFHGSGVAGRLGPRWALTAVLSLLRINQQRNQGKITRIEMIEAAERLRFTGILSPADEKL